MPFFGSLFLDSNRGAGMPLILGYTGSLFLPKCGYLPCCMRFCLPAICGLFCLTNSTRKCLVATGREKSPEIYAVARILCVWVWCDPLTGALQKNLHFEKWLCWVPPRNQGGRPHEGGPHFPISRRSPPISFEFRRGGKTPLKSGGVPNNALFEQKD